MVQPNMPEVHNAWTIYGLDTDRKEVDQLFTVYGRPQDWGHPRWKYHRFVFECRTLDQPIRNVCHCWTDLDREVWDFARLFAEVIVMPLTPGRPVQLCGRDYLSEEDMWFSDWGKQPPYYDEFGGDSGSLFEN
jgi:hypothetical protein